MILEWTKSRNIVNALCLYFEHVKLWYWIIGTVCCPALSLYLFGTWCGLLYKVPADEKGSWVDTDCSWGMHRIAHTVMRERKNQKLKPILEQDSVFNTSSQITGQYLMYYAPKQRITHPPPPQKTAREMSNISKSWTCWLDSFFLDKYSLVLILNILSA